MFVPCLRSARARFIGLVALSLASTAARTPALTTTTLVSTPPARAAQPVAPSGRIYVQIPHQPLSVYAHLATEIVHARVIGIEARFPEQGLPTTAYRIELLSALKGTTRPELVFQVAGAERAGQKVELVGAPHFALGEEVVLFLWTEPSTGATGLLGLDQGTYRVRRDERGAVQVSGLHASASSLSVFFDRIGEELARPAPWTR